MSVKRIVANIATPDVTRAKAFYEDILGMRVGMDLGWILTYVDDVETVPQISFMTEGGSPDLSIEVDNLDDVHRRVLASGSEVDYGPASEPWGVRRFYVRDPFGRLVNILTHE